MTRRFKSFSPHMITYSNSINTSNLPSKVTKETTRTYDSEGKLITEKIMEITEYFMPHQNPPVTTSPFRWSTVGLQS